MSIVNDALKRAIQQRQGNTAVALDREPAPLIEEHSQAPRNWLLPIFLVSWILAAGAFYWIYSLKENEKNLKVQAQTAYAQKKAQVVALEGQLQTITEEKVANERRFVSEKEAMTANISDLSGQLEILVGEKTLLVTQNRAERKIVAGLSKKLHDTRIEASRLLDQLEKLSVATPVTA